MPEQPAAPMLDIPIPLGQGEGYVHVHVPSRLSQASWDRLMAVLDAYKATVVVGHA